MTFLKTLNGGYVPERQLKYYFAGENDVIAYSTDGDTFTLAEGFESKSEAQKWLDDLIDELENIGCGR